MSGRAATRRGGWHQRLATTSSAVWGLALTLVAVASAPARGDEIDRHVEARMRALHIPGLSLAVVRDGRIVTARGYGFADLELEVPATPASVYEIGSTTKQFTAAAVMMLVEEGALKLDDQITKFFPEAPEKWGRITVRHLLTHTSGIQNHVAVPGYLGLFKTDLFHTTTPGRDQLLRMFFELPLEFEPGATWAYDNTGYYLLGIIVEKASGRPFWEFLSERIFSPLGMSSTRSTEPKPLVAHRASGYGWVNGAYENRPALPPPSRSRPGASSPPSGTWHGGTPRSCGTHSWRRRASRPCGPRRGRPTGQRRSTTGSAGSSIRIGGTA